MDGLRDVCHERAGRWSWCAYLLSLQSCFIILRPMYILGKIAGKPLFMYCSKVSSCKYRALNLCFFSKFVCKQRDVSSFSKVVSLTQSSIGCYRYVWSWIFYRYLGWSSGYKKYHGVVCGGKNLFFMWLEMDLVE